MCLHFLHDTRFIFIYMYTPHTRGYVHKKTKHREEFEPVIDKPAELLLCFYSRVTWWRETLWLEGRKTFTITWHHRIYPFEAQWFVSFPRFFFSFFLPRHFFDKHSLSVTSRYPKKIHFRNYWTSSLAAKFKGVESHFCFPPCLTPFTTTPAVPLSHSSNLSPSSPFLSFHQGSRGMLITERRRYRFEESAVARIFTRPANVNTIYIYVLYTLPTMRYHGDEKIHENNDLGRCRV